jgi:hypothetical protein
MRGVRFCLQRAHPRGIGTQAIKLPPAAAGHKAALSAWLGIYSSDRTEIRAIFVNSSGKTLTPQSGSARTQQSPNSRRRSATAPPPCSGRSLG